jgi:hypothetical protein
VLSQVYCTHPASSEKMRNLIAIAQDDIGARELSSHDSG